MLSKAVELIESILNRLAELGSSPPQSVRGERSYHRLEVEWQGLKFSIRVEETSKRFEIPENKKQRGTYSYWPRWRYEPKGLLELEINPVGRHWIRTKDGKSLIVSRIDEILFRMISAAFKETERLRVEEIRKQRAIEFLMKRDEKRREEEFEILRQKLLVKEARQWRRVNELRSYVDAIELEGHSSCRESLKGKQELREWLSWARGHIEKIDNIGNGMAASTPPYPPETDYTRIPHRYLEYDNPEDAYRYYEHEIHASFKQTPTPKP